VARLGGGNGGASCGGFPNLFASRDGSCLTGRETRSGKRV